MIATPEKGKLRSPRNRTFNREKFKNMNDYLLHRTQYKEKTA